MTDTLLEQVSKKVHEKWISAKRQKGVSSRTLDTTGEELMVPYDQLSEEAKDLDRGTVKATLDALHDLGYGVVDQTWHAAH